MNDAPQPDWLRVGARVRVAPSSSSRAETRTERVSGVQWPWLVHLEGSPGGVHPARCSPADV